MYELGLALKKQLCERVAELWEVTPEEVTYSEGVFTSGTRRMTFKALAKEIDDGRPLMASATVFPETEGPAFACHIVDVEADPETGKVQILRYTALQDVGKAIHPSYVEGQMQGGAAQGIGWALNEEYVYDADGHMLNASFLDYRMPTALDLPMIDTVMVEVPNPGHPFGVRGVGEVPIVPPPGALANALYRALGVRMTVLPMSPAHVLEALWAASAGQK
jgi:CO/xanthine dehydrogenase Mo-binding subunit